MWYCVIVTNSFCPTLTPCTHRIHAQGNTVRIYENPNFDNNKHIRIANEYSRLSAITCISDQRNFKNVHPILLVFFADEIKNVYIQQDFKRRINLMNFWKLSCWECMKIFLMSPTNMEESCQNYFVHFSYFSFAKNLTDTQGLCISYPLPFFGGILSKPCPIIILAKLLTLTPSIQVIQNLITYSSSSFLMEQSWMLCLPI